MAIEILDPIVSADLAALAGLPQALIRTVSARISELSAPITESRLKSRARRERVAIEAVINDTSGNRAAEEYVLSLGAHAQIDPKALEQLQAVRDPRNPEIVEAERSLIIQAAQQRAQLELRQAAATSIGNVEIGASSEPQSTLDKQSAEHTPPLDEPAEAGAFREALQPSNTYPAPEEDVPPYVPGRKGIREKRDGGESFPQQLHVAGELHNLGAMDPRQRPHLASIGEPTSQPDESANDGDREDLILQLAAIGVTVPPTSTIDDMRAILDPKFRVGLLNQRLAEETVQPIEAQQPSIVIYPLALGHFGFGPRRTLTGRVINGRPATEDELRGIASRLGWHARVSVLMRRPIYVVHTTSQEAENIRTKAPAITDTLTRHISNGVFAIMQRLDNFGDNSRTVVTSNGRRLQDSWEKLMTGAFGRFPGPTEKPAHEGQPYTSRFKPGGINF